MPTKVRAEEALFATLSGMVSSAAGFYFKTDGDLVVYVRDSAQFEAARAAMLQLASTHGLQGPRGGAAHVLVRLARYTFGDLAAWRDSVFAHAQAIEGIRTLDLDEEQNRVRIGILPESILAATQQLRNLLPALGVDTGAVVTYAAKPPVDEVNAFADPAAEIGAPWDTLAAGQRFESHHTEGWKPCTVGFVADRNSGSGVERVWVSGSHCTDIKFKLDGSEARMTSQNGRNIGYEIVDPEGYTCHVFAGICRGSDASVFSSTGPSQRGLIAKPALLNSVGAEWSSTYLATDLAHPYFIITSVENGELSVNSLVQKIGIRTGWTSGYVTKTCVDQWDNGVINTKITLCLYDTDYFSGGGDSGGPVFQRIGDTYEVKLVGVHTGECEQKCFSKYWRAVSDLGGSFNAVRGVNLAAPTATGSRTADWSPVVSWAAVAGASEYMVYLDEPVYEQDRNGTWRYAGRNVTYLGKTSATSYTDMYSSSSQYLGVAATASSQQFGYRIKAVGATDISPESQTVLFAWDN